MSMVTISIWSVMAKGFDVTAARENATRDAAHPIPIARLVGLRLPARLIRVDLTRAPTQTVIIARKPQMPVLKSNATYPLWMKLHRMVP